MSEVTVGEMAVSGGNGGGGGVEGGGWWWRGLHLPAMLKIKPAERF